MIKMKITRKHLRQIIKEELNKVSEQQDFKSTVKGGGIQSFAGDSRYGDEGAESIAREKLEARRVEVLTRLLQRSIDYIEEVIFPDMAAQNEHTVQQDLYVGFGEGDGSVDPTQWYEVDRLFRGGKHPRAPHLGLNQRGGPELVIIPKGTVIEEIYGKGNFYLYTSAHGGLDEKTGIPNKMENSGAATSIGHLYFKMPEKLSKWNLQFTSPAK